MVLDRMLFAAFAALIGLPIVPAQAQPSPPQPKPEMMENCPGMIAGQPPRAIPAALRLAALGGDQVRISYAGHSTFMIESPGGVKIATDYNDYVKPRVLPRRRGRLQDGDLFHQDDLLAGGVLDIDPVGVGRAPLGRGQPGLLACGDQGRTQRGHELRAACLRGRRSGAGWHGHVHG